MGENFKRSITGIAYKYTSKSTLKICACVLKTNHNDTTICMQHIYMYMYINRLTCPLVVASLCGELVVDDCLQQLTLCV